MTTRYAETGRFRECCEQLLCASPNRHEMGFAVMCKCGQTIVRHVLGGWGIVAAPTEEQVIKGFTELRALLDKHGVGASPEEGR